MIVRVREWYEGRTRREQLLLLSMIAIAAPVLAWLLVVQPLDRAYEAALQEQLEALDRHGRVKMLADLGRAKPAASAPAEPDVDLQLVVTQSAGQAGLALQSATPAGADRIEVAVEGSPATGIVRWLGDLEAVGVRVEELRMTPQPGGTANMSARLARLG